MSILDNFYKLLSFLFLSSILLTELAASACTSLNGFVIPGQYNLEKQLDSDSCVEWLAGPIVSPKLIFINFLNTNLDCTIGDNLIVYNEERTKILFEFCRNQNLYLLYEGSYLVLTVTSLSSRFISATFQYYIADITTTTTKTSAETFITSPSCPSSLKSIVIASKDATTGTIQSPNFPSQYPDNARCYWFIEAKPDERIYLEFDTINLPSYLFGVFYSNCPSDYLEITDYNNPSDSYKLCGDRRNFRVIVPYAKTMLFFYSTGINKGLQGFRLTFRFEKANSSIAAVTTVETTKSSTVTSGRITETTTTPTKTLETATFSNPDGCGVAYHKPDDKLLKIIGGSESVPHSWPWQVLLTYLNSSFICGGSLIKNNWIVTAAHCIDGHNSIGLRIYLGLHDRVNKEASTVTRTISYAIKNPNYLNSITTVDADIALLKLSQPVEYTNEIKPICLPSQGNNLAVLGKVGMVTGWGATKGFGSDQVLMQASVTVFNNSACNATSDNQVCAGQTGVFGRGACFGDSGGPLAILQNNFYFLTGIVSYGLADCSPPGVYTKVSNFIDWISSVIATNR